MEMYLYVAGGLLLLLAGGEFLVRGAVTLARGLGVSPLVIGLTVDVKTVAHRLQHDGEDDTESPGYHERTTMYIDNVVFSEDSIASTYVGPEIIRLVGPGTAGWVKPLPGTRMTITERAYTSPIWYTPES